jgi:hypothetical protein
MLTISSGTKATKLSPRPCAGRRQICSSKQLSWLKLFQSYMGRKVTKVVLCTLLLALGTKLAFTFKSSGILHPNLTSGCCSHWQPCHSTRLEIHKMQLPKNYQHIVLAYYLFQVE